MALYVPELGIILVELRYTLLRWLALLPEVYWTKFRMRDRLPEDLQVTLVWQLLQIRLAVVRLNVTVHYPLKIDRPKSSKLSLPSKIGLAAYVKVKQSIYGPRPTSTMVSYGTIETN